MGIVITFPISLFMCIKVVQEYERAVIFRLGRIKKGGAQGPGLFFIIPCIDQCVVVDLRTVSFDVPPQEILTKDSVTVAVGLKTMIDTATDPWGIDIERVEVKDVRLPQSLQRAMAAEGEQKASKALKEASDIISESPAALQLRYLQTLATISTEKNSTIVFPIPIEMFSKFIKQD